MTILPDSDRLPVRNLVACFNNTSATYKFYWLLSIVDEVEKGRRVIYKHDLFAGMISNAWYTVNYFHISFGKQDLFQQKIEAIRDIEQIPIDEDKYALFQRLISSANPATQQELRHFDKQVPHWFLSPWFPGVNQRVEIYRRSNDPKSRTIYALTTDSIILDPEWLLYIQTNAALIRSFCYWKLALYLQAKNPNVPDIANKLIKPASRNSLTRQRKNFWDLVIRKRGSVPCIYKDHELYLGEYAVEHFIPYSFVSHDLIWNLIPADKSFNSSKSNKLPKLDRYFDKFFAVQKMAVEVVKEYDPKNKFLEDYLTIFPNLDTEFSREKFRERIEPLILIASNNGFEYMQ